MRDPIAETMRVTGKSRVQVLTEVKARLLEPKHAEQLARDPRTQAALANLDRMIEHAKKTELNKDSVTAAILKWPGLYQTKTGRVIRAMPVSQVPKQLIDCGWRNVSHMRSNSDYTKLGLEVIEARYVGGVRPKKFCDVVVANDVKIEEVIASANKQMERAMEWIKEDADFECEAKSICQGAALPIQWRWADFGGVEFFAA